MLTCFDGVSWIGITGDDSAMADMRKEIERDNEKRRLKTRCMYNVRVLLSLVLGRRRVECEAAKAGF